ncbi:MFS transporter [Paludibacterium purpuratum]|uniref:Multidrug transporter MdfA n=1 Tax=Paludibacterium purpuratum TaxID=1144873 RepID=A0A4R7BDI5_9NEIS|nr:MFS transporter [Paludibacterium purpuratum]TDR82803.1 DHA1 family multidrug/chloramphenicol efflux transport protein-like MFS transporter [Paludibacterium purpuratum]
MQKHAALSPATLLFPLALVLFEFSVYIANDMIQPGMLAVVREFGVDASWVPTSMTGFLLGGALLPWLMGPLSDHIGRRPVMLWGVAFFILSCLGTLWSHDIVSFMVLRVLQGMGLCFISAVGYAAIQEAFEEKAAVKVTALMANVALIAPLVGPVAGAALVQAWPWRGSFMVIAAVATVSFVGLIASMPETVRRGEHALSLGKLARDYREVFANRRFVASALCIPLMALPLLGWIALSPVMLVEDAGMSMLQYGLWQVPVIGALIVGNLLLVKFADRWPLGHSVAVGRLPALAGVLVIVAGSLFPSLQFYFLIAGMSLVTLGEGLAFAVLYRFALTACDVAKGAVAASMTMLSMAVYACGIEGLKRAYLTGGYVGYALLVLLLTTMFFLLSRRMVGVAMAERAPGGRLAEEGA